MVFSCRFCVFFAVFALVFASKKQKKGVFFLATCRAKKKNAFSGPFYIAFLIERKTSFTICAKQSFLQKNSCYNIIFFSVVNDFFKCFSKIFQSVRVFLHARLLCACARAHSCVFIDTCVEPFYKKLQK